MNPAWSQLDISPYFWIALNVLDLLQITSYWIGWLCVVLHCFASLYTALPYYAWPWFVLIALICTALGCFVLLYIASVCFAFRCTALRRFVLSALLCIDLHCVALLYFALQCIDLLGFASYCFTSCCFALLRATMHYFVLLDSMLALHNFAWCCFASYCFTLFYIALLCIVFHWPMALTRVSLWCKQCFPGKGGCLALDLCTSILNSMLKCWKTKYLKCWDLV